MFQTVYSKFILVLPLQLQTWECVPARLVPPPPGGRGACWRAALLPSVCPLSGLLCRPAVWRAGNKLQLPFAVPVLLLLSLYFFFFKIMELLLKKIEVFSLFSLQKGQCYFGKAARKSLKQPKYVLQLKEALSLATLLHHHFSFVGTSFCATVCGNE